MEDGVWWKRIRGRRSKKMKRIVGKNWRKERENGREERLGFKILDQNDKLTTPDDFDKIVRAVIPDEQVEPKLYKAVLKHMIHGPCGVLNHKSPCMKQGSCKKGFPKEISNDTKQGNDSYPLYRRPQDRPAVPLRENSRVRVDNRWVVPYNPFLLLKYDCHINIEICSSIKCVKYLYKYIHKGSDRVSMEVHNGDEIAQYVDAR
ncbi:uncharacterized protein [Spinacia oleracea]|uniref:Uncharacterized protein n=1 Tax=Spinacia oleracea TaxID=3562 RepID=A0ABM3R943_SPIOL|nr:uncharacterized protein LOC110779472 [Spinacia oleracea]